MTDEESLRRRADQHWEMAGLARQDGDARDAERHTTLARQYDERRARLIGARSALYSVP